MVGVIIDIGGGLGGGVGGPGGGFGGPGGGFSDNRSSGKPLLLLRLKKPPSGRPRRTRTTKTTSVHCITPVAKFCPTVFGHVHFILPRDNSGGEGGGRGG